MKLFFVLVLFTTTVFAQEQNLPLDIIARNLQGEVLQQEKVQVKLSVIEGEPTGKPFYTEIHTLKTDKNGKVSLVLGQGDKVNSKRALELHTDTNSYFLRTEINSLDASGFRDIGTIKILTTSSIHTRNDIEFKTLPKSGFVADMVTDNTNIVQGIIDNMNSELGGEIYIPKNVKYDFRRLKNLPKNYLIHDNSTWDWRNQSWTAQIKSIISTDDPSRKNANEQIIMAEWHPALVLDNSNAADGEGRASIIFRSQGYSVWRLGMQRLNTDRNFVLASASPGFGLKTRLEVNSIDGGYGFNTEAKEGINYSFGNPNKSGNTVYKFISNQDNATEFLFSRGLNSIASRIQFKPDGNISFVQNGKPRTTLGANNTIYGFKYQVEDSGDRKKVNLTEADSKKILINSNKSGVATFYLPLASIGLAFRFNVTVNPIAIKINGEDYFREGKTKQTLKSTKAGSAVEVYSVADGIWEINEINGTWAFEK